MEVDVGPREDCRHAAPHHLALLGILLQTRQRQGTRRLGDGSGILEDVLEGGTDLVIADDDHLIQILLTEAEGLIPHPLDRHTIGKQRDPLQVHRLTSLQCRHQTGGAFGLDPDHLDVRQQLLDIDGDAGRQTTATDLHEDVGQSGVLLQQLPPYGALPGDDIGVIERRDQGVTMQLGQATTLGIGLIEAVTEQHHIAAHAPHRIDLDVRRGGRHHDGSLDVQFGPGERYPLGVVARRGGDDPLGPLLLGQTGNLVIGAAQLEGVHRLQILALEHHMVAQTVRDLLQHLQRGDLGHLVNRGEQDLA